MLRSVENEKLEPGMVLALPFGKTATITEVKVGRLFVSARYVHSKDGPGVTRLLVGNESLIEGPEE